MTNWEHRRSKQSAATSWPCGWRSSWQSHRLCRHAEPCHVGSDISQADKATSIPQSSTRLFVSLFKRGVLRVRVCKWMSNTRLHR